MERWYELEQIAQNVTYLDEPDSLIWKYNSSGIYSTSSLYHIINFRGIVPTFIPAVWSVVAPPRVQVFLWLVSQNKIEIT